MVFELNTDGQLDPGQVNRDLFVLIQACPSWTREYLWAHAERFTDTELIDGVTLVAAED